MTLHGDSLMKAKQAATKHNNSTTTVSPAVFARMDAIEVKFDQLLKLLQKSDGVHVPATSRPARVRTVPDPVRAQQIEDIFGDQVPVSRSTRRQLSREPRRQRKQRDMQPRALYSALPIDTPDKLHAAQDLVPAAAAILLYLGVHPKSTVPDVVASLDLRRKTVENRLSELRKHGLVRSESR